MYACKRNSYVIKGANERSEKSFKSLFKDFAAAVSYFKEYVLNDCFRFFCK